MNRFNTYGLWFSHVTLALAATMIFGTWQAARFEAQLANLQVAQAKKSKLAADAATQRLQAAQVRGDRLSSALLITEHLNDQLRNEVHRALNKKTTGRACLNEPTLRVLGTAPGITVGDLPAAASGAAAEGEAVATDTDIAHWVADAGVAYSTCSARLDALIDWHLAPLATEKTP